MKKELVDIWLIRAESNLIRAKTGKTDKKILYEDLCFDCQQSVEKSLKALMIFYDIEIIITHSILLLISTLEENKINIPVEISEAVILSNYAVRTRYPGFYEPVNEEEYNTALYLAEKVFSWVKKIVEE